MVASEKNFASNSRRSWVAGFAFGVLYVAQHAAIGERTSTSRLGCRQGECFADHMDAVSQILQPGIVK